jgi:hypothetical protein
MFTIIPMNENFDYTYSDSLEDAKKVAEGYDCTCAIKSERNVIICVFLYDEWVTYH